jgi:hypothetical protein
VRVVIAHCGWLPERKASLRRLLGQLPRICSDWVLTSDAKEHAAVWARRAWEWAARTNDHVVILNDDVILHPDFLKIVGAMIEAVPDECISLHTTAPAAIELQQQGHAWARCYHYTGPAVVLPPGAAASLLEYASALPWSFVSRINEDNLAIHWAWEKQRPFWCAIPAPVTHDTAIPSSLGYDAHPYRTPTVPARAEDVNLTDPARWAKHWDAPWMPNPWMSVDRMTYMRTVLKMGRHICSLCSELEGVVGDAKNGVMVCGRCLTAIDAARRAK